MQHLYQLIRLDLADCQRLYSLIIKPEKLIVIAISSSFYLATRDIAVLLIHMPSFVTH